MRGNSLTEEQITALLENKRVIAPQKDILDVQNVIKVYDQLQRYNPNSIKDLENAHVVLTQGLIENTGKLRSKNVGIVQGSKVKHIAPDDGIVKGLINDLFSYLKSDKDILLIKNCCLIMSFNYPSIYCRKR